MTAPDKLYIVLSETDGTDFTGWAWMMPQNDNPSIEYIRKDALVEMFLYAQEAAGGDYQKAEYQMAIDKLNTM